LLGPIAAGKTVAASFDSRAIHYHHAGAIVVARPVLPQHGAR